MALRLKPTATPYAALWRPGGRSPASRPAVDTPGVPLSSTRGLSPPPPPPLWGNGLGPSCTTREGTCPGQQHAHKTTTSLTTPSPLCCLAWGTKSIHAIWEIHFYFHFNLKKGEQGKADPSTFKINP